MNCSVAHENQSVALLNLKTEFIDFLSFHLSKVFGNFLKNAVADKNTARIVKLYQIGIAAVKNLKDTERLWKNV